MNEIERLKKEAEVRRARNEREFHEVGDLEAEAALDRAIAIAENEADAYNRMREDWLEQQQKTQRFMEQRDEARRQVGQLAQQGVKDQRAIDEARALADQLAEAGASPHLRGPGCCECELCVAWDAAIEAYDERSWKPDAFKERLDKSMERNKPILDKLREEGD